MIDKEKAEKDDRQVVEEEEECVLNEPHGVSGLAICREGDRREQ